MSLFSDDQIVTIATDQSMASDFYSAVFDIRAFDCAGLQFTWVGANALTAKILPQVSIDGVNYCDYISSNDARRIDAASGCGMYEIQRVCFRYLRARMIAGTNSAGTISIMAYAKRLKAYA